MESLFDNRAHTTRPNRLSAGPIHWLFDAQAGSRTRFVPRWMFMRALAIFYFSAFHSLLFQIEGLIGPRGVLPAEKFLAALRGETGPLRFWYAPTLFWISSGEHMMIAVTWLGLIASIAALFNLWPRLSFFLCLVCFLSFVTAAEAFSSYQSDGMLLEAGFIALFFAPRGLFPGLGTASPTSRASLFLLQWEWFRIYFESGLVKLLSGDPEWRNFTAIDEYYQNGPLPTWIGWYVEHLPHWFHAATVAGTLAMELAVVWILFLPRRARLLCFCIVTLWQIGVILTANYTFLNYLVLALCVLLLDDRSVRSLLPQRIRSRLPTPPQQQGTAHGAPLLSPLETSSEKNEKAPSTVRDPATYLNTARTCVTAIMLTWIAYATTVEMIRMPWPDLPLPSGPLVALEPFRIANQYGLFAVMTRGRYEIEFQGSNDGQRWTPYPFRYKPQDPRKAPGIFAPYQPRFDWNMWFASLEGWEQNRFVVYTEERLLTGSPSVLALFAGNPFPSAPPAQVRAMVWQYWFSDRAEKNEGLWWRRELIGTYAPSLERQPDGKFT